MKLDDADVIAFPRKARRAYDSWSATSAEPPPDQTGGVRFPPDTRRHFRREAENWLEEIQSLRFKPDNRTGPLKFYFDLLFDYPFGGVEVQNVRRIMDLVLRQHEGAQPIRTSEEMVEWLREFHTRLAERLHNGEDVLDMIPE